MIGSPWRNGPASPGTLTRLTREEFSLGYRIGSVCFICPICRQKWGEINAAGEHLFVPEMVSCPICKWTDEFHPVFGSLLVNSQFSEEVDWDLLNYLPLDLLWREFDLTMESLK